MMTVHTMVGKLKPISLENMVPHKAMLLQRWLEHTECHLKLEILVVVEQTLTTMLLAVHVMPL